MGSASHCLEGLSQEGSGAPEPLCPSGSCGHTLAPAARWRAGLGPLLSVRSEVCRWCRGIQRAFLTWSLLHPLPTRLQLRL